MQVQEKLVDVLEVESTVAQDATIRALQLCYSKAPSKGIQGELIRSLKRYFLAYTEAMFSRGIFDLRLYASALSL